MLERNVNPTQEYISDYLDLDGGIVIHRYSLIGTSLVAYEVLERSSVLGAHSTITFHQNRWYGSLTTRKLPQYIDVLPLGSNVRIAAVQAYHEELERQAEAIVRAAFPADFTE